MLVLFASLVRVFLSRCRLARPTRPRATSRLEPLPPPRSQPTHRLSVTPVGTTRALTQRQRLSIVRLSVSRSVVLCVRTCVRACTFVCFCVCACCLIQFATERRSESIPSPVHDDATREKGKQLSKSTALRRTIRTWTAWNNNEADRDE